MTTPFSKFEHRPGDADGNDVGRRKWSHPSPGHRHRLLRRTRGKSNLSCQKCRRCCMQFDARSLSPLPPSLSIGYTSFVSLYHLATCTQRTFSGHQTINSLPLPPPGGYGWMAGYLSTKFVYDYTRLGKTTRSRSAPRLENAWSSA